MVLTDYHKLCESEEVHVAVVIHDGCAIDPTVVASSTRIERGRGDDCITAINGTEKIGIMVRIQTWKKRMGTEL